MMTYQQLYNKTKQALTQAGLESPAFDAICLFEHVFGLNRQQLIMRGNEQPAKADTEKLNALVKKRSKGEPLQYLIGKWSFMQGEFFVGEGVLIPREDTQPVAELCMQGVESFEDKQKLSIIDLCSGSGAIAVNLAMAYKTAKVTALEYSKKAFDFLEKNVELNAVGNCKPWYANVFTAYKSIEDNAYSVIISNPPYIETKVLETLQAEVQKEPKMALDGGEDGLVFYRAIIDNWSKKLKPGGILVFELGEGQDRPVEQMLLSEGYKEITFAQDMQGINRGVMAVRTDEK